MAGLHRVNMHDLLGKSHSSREMDKIRKPSMLRLGDQMALARETEEENA